MKVFGKKTLALVLTIAMALSLCSFTAFAEGEPVPVTEVTLTPTSATLYVGAGMATSVSLSAVVAPDNATDKTLNWSTSDSDIAAVTSSGLVTAKKVGNATITATSVSNSEAKKTCAIEVKAATVDSIAPTSVTVAFNQTEDQVKAALAAKELTISYKECTEKGKDKIPAEAWSCTTTYDGTKPGMYAFTATYGETTCTATVTVTLNKAQLKSGATNLGTIAEELGTSETRIDLPTTVKLAFEEIAEPVSFGIGGKSDYYEAWTCTAPSGGYDMNKEATYTFTAKAKPHALYDLKDLTIKVFVYDDQFEQTYNMGRGGTLASVAEDISNRLNLIYKDTLDTIVITDIEGETVKREEHLGGTLYTDNACDQEVEEDEDYSASELAKMYYLPNGSGYETYLTFEAWTDDSDESIEGVITLKSDEYLLLTAEIDDKGTVPFSADDFENLIADWDDDYTLDYVKFSSIPNSTSKGYLYTEYDEDSSKNTLAKTSVKYYAEPEGKDLGLDDLTYVPGSKTSGVVDIEFTAYCVKGKTNKSVTGVYQINVIEKADLTIEAGVKESVSFDLDMFEEFYQENISKNYKNYDIVAVSFSGVPNSKEKGYLRNDGKSIKSPNDKKFYIDSDKEGDYAFEDLTFEGGSKASTTRAEFTVYAKKDGKGTAKTVTGTIDFIVGSTHSLSGSIKASETMKFAASLSAFEDLGGNDNVYVTFTGLPTGGKLVYNWGTGSQEDVKAGTEYYLSYKAGKKLLSSVTFVPSYSSSKQARTISIPVKAYNSKEKAVTGTINITVNYAAYSSKFTDITTSTYADSVDFLYNQGITTGMTATTFGPNSNVTRAQFVTFLYRAAGQPAVTGVTNKFTDVKSTGTYAYAYNAILWAVQNNITTGRSATKFDPAANVTHQELLTFLYRYDVNYLGHPGTQGSLSGFSDASSLQSYAVAPAKWAAYKGIVSGYTLQPAVAGSRATVALWLHRMLTL